MFGALVISLLAAGGACCGTCWGVLMFSGLWNGGGVGAILLCVIVTLSTFAGVMIVLSRTIRAAREAQESKQTRGAVEDKADQ